mmetsp:Transcript_43008/g.91461  ORF Transcript_43008/g.91461 Transcript_43008/m.91461 type:complete len:321 (-) Transcript_43008:15-977(-)
MAPTGSPIPRRSKNPADHNFCGLGFNNLFGCAIKCPNGSPAECPSGQLCYFDTKCDARVEGIILGDPTRTPTPPPTHRPTISPKPTEYVDLGLPDGRSNFCGETVFDARNNCNRDRHCPSGSNDECPGDDMYCWIDLLGCNIRTLPSATPTISPRPTPYPSIAPTTRDPSFTYEPTNAPLDKDDIRNFFFCGTSWGDASTRCHKRCLSGHHSECPGEEECFAQAACSKLIENQPPASSPDDESQPANPTVSPKPTPVAVETPEPTNSPLEKGTISSREWQSTHWARRYRRHRGLWTRSCNKSCTSRPIQLHPGVARHFFP